MFEETLKNIENIVADPFLSIIIEYLACSSNCLDASRFIDQEQVCISASTARYQNFKEAALILSPLHFGSVYHDLYKEKAHVNCLRSSLTIWHPSSALI